MRQLVPVDRRGPWRHRRAGAGVDHRRPPRRGPTRHRGRRGPWRHRRAGNLVDRRRRRRTSTRTGSSPLAVEGCGVTVAPSPLVDHRRDLDVPSLSPSIVEGRGVTEGPAPGRSSPAASTWADSSPRPSRAVASPKGRQPGRSAPTAQDLDANRIVTAAVEGRGVTEGPATWSIGADGAGPRREPDRHRWPSRVVASPKGRRPDRHRGAGTLVDHRRGLDVGQLVPVDRRGPRREGDRGGLVTAAVEGRGVTVLIPGVMTANGAGRHRPGPGRSSPAASRLDAGPPPISKPAALRGALTMRFRQARSKSPDLPPGASTRQLVPVDRRGPWRHRRAGPDRHRWPSRAVASPWRRRPWSIIAGASTAPACPRRRRGPWRHRSAGARVDHRRPPRRGPARHRGRRGPWRHRGAGALVDHRRGLDVRQLAPVDRRGPWRHRRARRRVDHRRPPRRGPTRHRGRRGPWRHRRAGNLVDRDPITAGPRRETGSSPLAVEGCGVTVAPSPRSIIAGTSTWPSLSRRSSRAVASPKGRRPARSSPAASTWADSSPRPSRAVASPKGRQPGRSAPTDRRTSTRTGSSPRPSRAVASPKGRQPGRRADMQDPRRRNRIVTAGRRGLWRHRGAVAPGRSSPGPRRGPSSVPVDRRGPWRHRRAGARVIIAGRLDVGRLVTAAVEGRGVTEGPATWSIGAAQPQDLDANRIVTAGRRGLWRHRRAVARIVTVGPSPWSIIAGASTWASLSPSIVEGLDGKGTAAGSSPRPSRAVASPCLFRA